MSPKTTTKYIEAPGEEFSPTEKSSNIKFHLFSFWGRVGDNFGLPVQSESETLHTNMVRVPVCL